VIMAGALLLCSTMVPRRQGVSGANVDKAQGKSIGMRKRGHADTHAPQPSRTRCCAGAARRGSIAGLFAEGMRVLRLQRERSPQALADLCDLDRTYISNIERKRCNVSIRNIQRIADALDVDARKLLDIKLTSVENLEQ